MGQRDATRGAAALEAKEAFAAKAAEGVLAPVASGGVMQWALAIGAPARLGRVGVPAVHASAAWEAALKTRKVCGTVAAARAVVGPRGLEAPKTGAVHDLVPPALEVKAEQGRKGAASGLAEVASKLNAQAVAA